MGCLNSKTVSVKTSNDDFHGLNSPVSALLFSSSSYPLHKDAIQLTHRQAFSLKQSWKGIKRSMEDTGVEMFVRLFRSDKELQNLFHKFKHIKSDNELRSNEALEYHATLVMSTIDEAIIHIDDYDYVKSLLSTSANSHLQFFGFKPDIFLAIKEPFLEAVRVTLGDRYTENIQTIYEITITFILQTMVDSIKEGYKKIEDAMENGSV